MTTLVALHGFTGSGEDFASFAPLLRATVLALDLPGHGKNAALPCTLDAVEALLDPGASILLGYSMGARLALHLALRRPPRGLILISGSPGLADAAERAARRAADEALARQALALGPAFADLWEKTPILASQQAIPSPARERLRARRRQNDPAGLAAALRGLGTGALPPLWELLGGLDVPTLVLVGERDTKFNELGQAMTRALPSATFAAVPSAGHSPHLEAPEPTAAHVNAFLDRL